MRKNYNDVIIRTLHTSNPSLHYLVNYYLWVSEWAEFYVPLVTGHFEDESFQAITCTSNDNWNIQEKIHQKHKTNRKQTNKPCL